MVTDIKMSVDFKDLLADLEEMKSNQMQPDGSQSLQTTANTSNKKPLIVYEDV